VRISSSKTYTPVGRNSFSIKLASGGAYTGRLFAEHKNA
jgi:hypothetical protein